MADPTKPVRFNTRSIDFQRLNAECRKSFGKRVWSPFRLRHHLSQQRHVPIGYLWVSEVISEETAARAVLMTYVWEFCLTCEISEIVFLLGAH